MPNQVTSQLIWNITYSALNITYTFIDEFVTISYSCAEERPSRTKAPLHTKKLKLSPLSQNSKKRKKHTAGRLSILTYTRKETWLTASDSKTCKVCFYNFGVQQARGSAPLIFQKKKFLLWVLCIATLGRRDRAKRMRHPAKTRSGPWRLKHWNGSEDWSPRNRCRPTISRSRCCLFLEETLPLSPCLVEQLWNVINSCLQASDHSHPKKKLKM